MSKTKKTKLSNGVTLLYTQHNNSRASSFRYYYLTGSTFASNGVAHFFEHMLFTRTQKYDHDELHEKLNKISPGFNAFTGPFDIHYLFKRSDKLFEQGVELAAEILLHPCFTQHYMDKEKGVISEEINMVNNDTERVFNLACNENVLGNSPHRGLGTINDIHNMTIKKLNNYRQKIHYGENIVISVSSHMSFYKIKKIIKKHFTENIPSMPDNVDHRYDDFTTSDKAKLLVVTKDTDSVYYNAHIRIPLLTKENKDSFSMALHILRKDMHKALRSNGMVYTSGITFFKVDNNTIIDIELQTSPNKLKKSLEIIHNTIQHRLLDKISEEELQQQKDNFFLVRDEHVLAQPSSLSAKAVQAYCCKEPLLKNYKAHTKIIKKITLDDLNNALKTVFIDYDLLYHTSLVSEKNRKYIPSKKVLDKYFTFEYKK